MSKGKIALIVVAVLLIPFALGFYNILVYGTLAPRYMNVKRKVFKATRSYNESKIQDLSRYYFQYQKGDTEERAVLASTIRHMFADYNVDEMPTELKTFLKDVRGY